MEKRELTCIRCPIGCRVTVSIENGEVTEVTGNTCPRGDDYARKEVINPTRTVTSIVRIEGGALPVLSVKTREDIPKGKMGDVLKELRTIVMKAPVKAGDIVLANAAGTGVDVIATKDIA